MRTLQEKYNGIQEGKFTKELFLAEARMQQPQLITRFNGYDDAVQILKNRGMIQEAINYDNLTKHSDRDLESLIDVKKKEREKLTLNKNTPPAVKSQDKELGAQIGKIERELNSRKPQAKRETVEEEVDTKTKFDIIDRNGNIKDSNVTFFPNGIDYRAGSKLGTRDPHDSTRPSKVGGVQEAAQPKPTKKGLADYRYKPTNEMDKYPYEQILRGIRVELEAAGVLGTPTPEEYTKALAKVSKNLEKDSIFYTNQVAGVNPKVDLHDKMVPFTEKAAVDTFNGMKKAQLKEGFKKLIKKVLSEGKEGDDVFEMYGENEEDIPPYKPKEEDTAESDEFYEGKKSLSELLK